MQTEPASTPDARARRTDIVLVFVVAVAVMLAIGSVVEDAASLPEGAFASVNGEALPVAQLQGVLLRLGEQLDHPPGAAERAEVVARLVDEELLLQQGLALGLVRAETRLRSQLVQEVIRQAVAESAAAPVSEADVREFLQRNAGYFRRADRFVVERLRFASREEAARAVGADAATLARGTRDDTLPATPLSEARWRDHLGSALAARVVALPVGGILAESGTALLRLAGRVPGEVPDLQDIRPQVEAEFRRRRDEDALSRYVARLRRDARILTEVEAGAP
jgi:hypothetical protein